MKHQHAALAATFVLTISSFAHSPVAEAESLKEQWFLGKWHCSAGDAKLQMTGLVADDAEIACSKETCTSQSKLTYQFHAVIQGLTVKMNVADFTETAIKLKDDGGTLIDLTRNDSAVGGQLTGAVKSEDAMSQLTCTRPARYQKPKAVPHVQAGFNILPRWLFGE
jgi:hypothetical protein